MRYNKIIFIVIISFTYLSKSVASVENNIILKVENQIITNFEIKNKIISTLILGNQEINQVNINKLKKQALDFLIQHKLKTIELSKYNFKKDNKQIENYLNAISNNNINNLKEKFSNNNIDFQLFLDELEIHFKWQKYIFQVYSKKIEIDEKSVDLELEKLIKEKSDIVQFQLSEIEIFLSDDLTDKEKIFNIKKQINEYGFETTAVKFSISSTASKEGDLGWMNADSLNKNIYELISKINVGEVTEPLITKNRALFLKLKDKKISKVENININELRRNLVDQKKNEMFNLYSRSHLSKLKNTSLIEYN